MLKKAVGSVGVITAKYILLCMFMLFLFNTMLYILYSLHVKFTSLDNKVQSYLTLLTDTLTISEDANEKLFKKQTADIIKDSTAIKAINVYTFDKKIPIQRYDEINFLSLLTNSEHHISKNIYAAIDSKTNKHIDGDTLLNTEIHSIQTSNTLNSSGYIKLSIDLKALRADVIQDGELWYIISLLLHLILTIVLIQLLKELHRPLAHLHQQSEEVIASNDILTVHTHNHKPVDNEYSIVESALYKLVNQHNTSLEVIATNNAMISQHKQARALISNQKKDFQKLITSELKTSLNAMTGGLQLLGQQYLSEEQQDALTIIRKSNYQLNFMLEQISQLNKIKDNKVSTNFITFNPIQVISDLVLLFEDNARKKGVIINSQISHIDHMLEGDIEKIRTILDALLDNAVKYTAAGEITIESSLQHFDETTRWIIKIIDTGIGIDKRYFDDIFTPFFQVDNSINTEHTAIGVGLSIAKQLANLIDVDLHVHSDGKTGTCFEVYLTLFDKKQSLKRSMLKNVSICTFEALGANNTIKGLEKFGAHMFNVLDYDSLFNQSNGVNSDVLIINTELEYKEIFSTIEKIRSTEKNQRVFIIWLVINKDLIDEGQALSCGIDVILNTELSAAELADVMNKWLH